MAAGLLTAGGLVKSQAVRKREAPGAGGASGGEKAFGAKEASSRAREVS
jgi:hypothetical protein